MSVTHGIFNISPVMIYVTSSVNISPAMIYVTSSVNISPINICVTSIPRMKLRNIYVDTNILRSTFSSGVSLITPWCKNYKL